ncbi:hypothetical protein ACOSP7_009830 [Xanthoceras sorbifolium]
MRNCEGVPAFVASKFFENSFDVEVTEALSVYNGLLFAVDRGLFPCVVESDAFNITKLCGDLISSRGEISNVVTDIRFLFDNHDFKSLCFVPRCCDMAAHSVAKWVMLHKQGMSWVVCPDWLKQSILSDCIPFSSF